jgi:hypothetical protein
MLTDLYKGIAIALVSNAVVEQLEPQKDEGVSKVKNLLKYGAVAAATVLVCKSGAVSFCQDEPVPCPELPISHTIKLAFPAVGNETMDAQMNEERLLVAAVSTVVTSSWDIASRTLTVDIGYATEEVALVVLENLRDEFSNFDAGPDDIVYDASTNTTTIQLSWVV